MRLPLGFTTLLAVGLIGTGLFMAAFGNVWGPRLFKFLEGSEVGLWLQLVAPFLPVFMIALGALLYTRARQGRNEQ